MRPFRYALFYAIGIICLFAVFGGNTAKACDNNDLTDYSTEYLLANYTPCGGHWWAKRYKCNGDTL